MLKQKFWQIKNDSKNCNFFMNKIQGINTEILMRHIIKLEEGLNEK